MILRTILISALLALTACSTQDSNENVLLEQTRTMDKAKAVEDTLIDAQKQRRESEEEQSGQ